VIDLSSGDVVRKIPVGLNPQHLALAPDGRVHVVCTGDYAATPGRIYVLDKDVESVVDSVLVGGSPLSVAITPSGKGYIGANFDGLLAYDALSLAITAPIGAPVLAEDGIFDVALDPSGSRLVVTDFGADALYFLDTDTDSVTATVTVGDGPLAVAYRP
jgi:YVTN family beta-propeller protein